MVPCPANCQTPGRKRVAGTLRDFTFGITRQSAAGTEGGPTDAGKGGRVAQTVRTASLGMAKARKAGKARKGVIAAASTRSASAAAEPQGQAASAGTGSGGGGGEEEGGFSTNFLVFLVVAFHAFWIVWMLFFNW